MTKRTNYSGHIRLLAVATLAVALGAAAPGASAEDGASPIKATLTDGRTGQDAGDSGVTLYAQKRKSSRGKKPNRRDPQPSRKSPARSKKARVPAAETLPWPDNVKALAGSGAVLVVDHHAARGEPSELISLNPDRDYVPASILKLVTSAAALSSLGPGYRFRTGFYLDRNGDLWIKGYGDPYLVSEELCLLADQLKSSGLSAVRDIRVDDSFFEEGVIGDGVTFTRNPYDAYNSAFGVNFNTVSYLIDRRAGMVELNECTPITKTARDIAAKSRGAGGQGRGKKKKSQNSGEVFLNISESPRAAEANGAEVMRELLVRRGVEITGEIFVGGEVPSDARLIYEHTSTQTLQDMLTTLLRHSNNFMTNQIFLTMGAERYGAPGDFEKGRQVVLDFLSLYQLPKLTLVEGSGLSRNNHLTARQMAEVLRVMEPARSIIRSDTDGTVFYKTGTMTEVQTLAGYIERPGRPDEPLSFVILLNGKYESGTRNRILAALKAHLVDGEGEEETGRV
ncbi:MAG: D-alanyl-D-alanine carboxypeptidase [Deltaproteobacteria bacterium]|jgi:D-alanyl-D-alanine carboxypeptidase/D-alanyl-D-alanine-endopeptidase (penicillin-binding protein 4)|nr:D-alanyl-D-alanine carboxypeptidase [Deltaproteobacteria bacterium]